MAILEFFDYIRLANSGSLQPQVVVEGHRLKRFHMNTYEYTMVPPFVIVVELVPLYKIQIKKALCVMPHFSEYPCK